MMENHSYDNYFGLLPGRGEGLPLGADGNPAAVTRFHLDELYPRFGLATTLP